MALLAVAVWAGSTMAFSRTRWANPPDLAARIVTYLPGSWDRRRPAGIMSAISFQEVLGPIARGLGDRIAGIVGIETDLATRLLRVHSDLTPTAARVRQMAIAVAAFAVTGVALAVLGAAPAVSTLLLLAAPLLAFLIQEQQLSRRAEQWQDHLFLELPTVCEHLGMLLGSGYSLGSAIARLSERSDGATARDLRRVGDRTRQGLDQHDALLEWAAVAQLPAVDRLVSVLALNRTTGDLGRLISDEARAVRREVHRRTVADAERRAQQVWIPVTVATLVPGTIFLAVPFLSALQIFSGR